MKIRYLLIPLVVLLLLSLFLFPIINLPYTVRSRAVVYAKQEWVLTLASDGQLAYTLTDHFNNSVSDYTITEFQRGDHAGFLLHDDIFKKGRVNQGDTVGVIHSNEEQRLYLELLGELENREKLLSFYLSGERPQDVAIAYQMMNLAEKEFQTQQKLMDRAQKLFQENVIPSQEYEIARNEFESKQMAYEIAQAEYEAVRSGSKPEQLELVRSEIRSLQAQIDQVASRLQAFTILAPFSGIIIRDHQQEIINPTFIRIADDSAFIAVMPVEVHQLNYIEVGQKVNLVPENRAQAVQATIAGIGNSVQLINRRQNVFITAIIDDPLPHILPGMLILAEIDTGTIPLSEYASRLTKTIYAN